MIRCLENLVAENGANLAGLGGPGVVSVLFHPVEQTVIITELDLTSQGLGRVLKLLNSQFTVLILV